MIASISDQVKAMAERYPALKPEVSDNACLWRGPLKPASKSYDLRIAYQVPQVPTRFHVRHCQPRVQVFNPILERHPEYEEGPIPHIYTSRNEPDYPILCLFDPYGGEWCIDDLLVDTTLPWTERWLLNYEYWLATGLWKGGGRHVVSPSQAPKTLSAGDDSPVRTVSPFMRALSWTTSEHAYDRVGRQ